MSWFCDPFCTIICSYWEKFHRLLWSAIQNCMPRDYRSGFIGYDVPACLVYQAFQIWLSIKSWILIPFLRNASILLPPIFSKFSLEMVGGPFAWPLSERRPGNVLDMVVYPNQTEIEGYLGHTTVQVDEAFRIFLITLILGPLMYWSFRLFKSNYRMAIRLHQFLLVLYRECLFLVCWIQAIKFMILCIFGIFSIWSGDLAIHMFGW